MALGVKYLLPSAAMGTPPLDTRPLDTTPLDTRPLATQPETLRERRRLLLTDEIEQAALDLFTARGFAQVTVDDIAAAVGISRRTFFRYFATKEDVLVADKRVRAERVQAAFDARPPDEPVLTSLHRVFVDVAHDMATRRDALVRREAVRAADPVLRARVNGQVAPWNELLIRSVATRLRVDPAVDIRPSLLVLASVAAFHAAMRVWVADDGADLVGLYEAGAALLADGLASADDLVTR
jgi:AcrR family transcriptional regulator